MRWLFALIAVFGYIALWQAPTPGLRWLGLGIGIIFSILAVLAFAQVRINGSAREESLSDAQMDLLKRSMHPPKSQARPTNRSPS
ncbi:MAG: hypothetical protein L0H70_04075 [Xanthomonadales bacterium]|nr:hypothetical protein [Xanthomonadales bacterium]